MRAVVVHEPGSYAVETVPEPVPGPRDVLVEVGGCGICGTDLHILDHGLPTATYPLIPGHEPWGRVAGLGGEVEIDVAVGDVVAVDPSLHCGACDRCRIGRGNLCRHWGGVGVTQPGAWAERVAVPQRTVYPLGRDYPTDCASLIEPVACALRGLDRLQPDLDASAIVVGAGTMGLLLALLLEIRGVGPVTLVEQNERRRRIASDVTRATVLAPAELATLEAKYVIDATGHAGAIESAMERVAPGGTFMVFGVAAPEDRVKISPFAVYQREMTIVGSMAILKTFEPAVETVRRHAAAFRPLATHSFPLEEFRSALDALRGGEGAKITISPTSTPDG